ncbi:MAG TPA: hypothetical protein VGR81_03535 [Candidatus Acidoferrales bacterium]|nr:hypothetical protein [Candidatus Acidoferrales bacterium]
MRLSLKSMAISCGLLWGGVLLFVGLINIAWPAYGVAFLEAMSSVYPGFHATHTLGDALIAAIEGLADGAVGGLLFAWLYNLNISEPVSR